MTTYVTTRTSMVWRFFLFGCILLSPFTASEALGQSFNVDAALNWTSNVTTRDANGHAYFFSGTEYVRYRLGGTAPNTEIRDTQSNWGFPSGWDGRIDAAVNWSDSLTYFFSGTEYVRYHLSGTAPDTDVRDTQANWNFPSGWGGRVDAAIKWDNDLAYFFSGNEYVRYRLGESVPDSDVRDTQTWWKFPPSWNGIVDAAINWGDGVTYFFNGSEYVRYLTNGTAPDTDVRDAQTYWNWGITDTGQDFPNEVPQLFALQGSYPNPFNPVTRITFMLPRSGATQVAIYNLDGRNVALLNLGVRTSGEHSVSLDLSDQPSGIYMYEVRFERERRVGKMVLVK